MTQEAAIYNFFNQFGIPGYPTTAVPQDPVLPYLTYQPTSGYWENISNITVQVWMRTESEATINAKAREIGDTIGFFHLLPCDGGVIKVSRGDPFSIPANAQDDPALKLRQLNVRLEFLTTR